MHEDDNRILRILGLSRDEFTALLAVFAILLIALAYFRGCAAVDQPPLADLGDGEVTLTETDAETESTEITDVRIAYRPNFVHFDGVGTDSEDVQVFLNGEMVGETQTTFTGKWSYEVRDLEPGFYEVYAIHPDIEDSQSATRVIQIVADENDGHSVRLLPTGATLAAAQAGSQVGAIADSDRATLLRPAFDPALALTGLTAGAISLNGTGSPNIRHLLFINGEEVDATIADADGNWSFVYDQPNAGDYDVSIIAVDGDTEIASSTVQLGLTDPVLADSSGDEAEADSSDQAQDEEEQDLTAEAVPTATPEPDLPEDTQESAASDSAAGSEAEEDSDNAAETGSAEAPEYLLTISDLPTNVNSEQTTTIGGEATPGTTVGLFVDGVFVHTAEVGEDGSWSFSAVFPPGTSDISAQLFANGDITGSPDKQATAQLDISPARDIALINSGQNGLVQISFGMTEGDSGSVAAGPVSSEVPAVELILDASWSMTLPLDSNEEDARLTADDPNSRISVAREALVDLVENALPEGAPVALRSFGNIEGNFSCRSDLMSELQPLDRENLVSTIQAIEPQFNADTAIGASLAQVRNDLSETDRRKVVVLLTDGQETCGRDPAIVIETLAAEGTEVQVNIIGFAIQDEALKSEFEEWAELGNGVYYDALNANILADALAESMTIGYLVTDIDGNTIERGIVSGRPLELEPGIYNIVNSNGDVIYENVIVTSSSANELIVK